MTPIESARIRLEGAQSNHKPTKHLRKQYILAVAKELKREMKEPKPMPLFEVRA